MHGSVISVLLFDYIFFKRFISVMLDSVPYHLLFYYSGFIFAFVWGLIWGSFGGTIIYRVPRGISLSSPSYSFCPLCRRRLLWYHKIPFLSFLVLRGKCAFCGGKIPLFYLATELSSAFVSLLAWKIVFGNNLYIFTDSQKYLFVIEKVGFLGNSIMFFLIFIFFWCLVIATVSDILYLLIPVSVIYVSLGVSLLMKLITGGIWDSFLGILIGSGLLYIVRLAYKLVRRREGLGEGDILIMLPVGIMFGFWGTLMILILSTFSGGIFAFLLAILRRQKKEYQIPFVPFIFSGVIIYTVITLIYPEVKYNYLLIF